ncbi:hypothetical protein EDB85DRAFT_2152711 [Lactarius pseudohatsudake]|nr:hypothetical protein EDB85DRAFT_2152711 [Lactarius pseudohatsudake]
MSLPTIQNLTTTDLMGHHLILAVILILKHATFLRLSNLRPKSAVTHAELDYRAGNIDLNIQQYLMASSQVHSVELFADFIMATEILPSQSSATDILPSNSSATDIVPSNSSVNSSVKNREKDHWFKRFWGPVFPRKSISLPTLRNTGKDNKIFDSLKLVPLPQNSLFTLECTKDPAERGTRISLTFRPIGTFLMLVLRIYGQNTTGKTRAEARPVVFGGAQVDAWSRRSAR